MCWFLYCLFMHIYFVHSILQVLHCNMLQYSAIYCICDIIDMCAMSIIAYPILRCWQYIETLSNPTFLLYNIHCKIFTLHSVKKCCQVTSVVVHSCARFVRVTSCIRNVTVAVYYHGMVRSSLINPVCL